MKSWIFYVILAWQIGPLAPVEQKTLVLQFDSLKECLSIADQVGFQIKQMRSIFHLKQVSCLSCESLYGKERCGVKRSTRPPVTPQSDHRPPAPPSRS